MPTNKELTNSIVNKAMAKVRDRSSPRKESQFMTNPVKLLSDDEVAEIEKRRHAAVRSYHSGDDVNWFLTIGIPALCQTVRALRTERLEIQRALASSVLNDPTEDDDVPYSTTELVEGVRWLIKMKKAKQERNTALREQLAERDQILAWIENKLSLHRELRTEDPLEQRLQAALHVICSHADGYRNYIETGKNEVARLKDQLAQVTQERNDAQQTLAVLRTCRNNPCGHCAALIQVALKDASTAMRDRCVAKLVALAHTAKAKDELTAFHALLDAASDLESLTLDQVEQEKSK